MKTTILAAFLACAGVSAHAQVSAAQVAAIKTLLTTKTWKTQSTMINGFNAADFESSNNIHNVNIFPTGDRFKFSADGTYTLIMAAGGSKQGIWDVNQAGQLIFNPGQNGGTQFGLTKADATGFSGRTVKRLGLCSVTSLYEVAWVSAE